MMKKRIQKELSLKALTKQEIRTLAERFHFGESDLPEMEALCAVLYPLLHVQVCCLLKERQAVCLVTLGEGIDKIQEECMQEGELLRAYMLDCLGNVILEKVYEEVEDILCRETGKYAGQYQFPEGEQILEWGKDLVNENESIVRFLKMGMMKPKKSVLYAVSLGEREEKRKNSICESCSKKDCRYRCCSCSS